MSDIKFVTLISGLSVLCKYKDINSSAVRLKKPVRLMQTQEGLAMTPMNPFAKHEDITVSKTHILCVEEPQDPFVQDYEQNFGSGLALPASSLVTP